MATCIRPDRQTRPTRGDQHPSTRLAAVIYPISDTDARVLVQHLGAEWDIVDARDCDDPDLVLLRPCSPQTVAGLRRRFPHAHLIAIEFGWVAPGGGGPIGRAVAAGLDGYTLGLADLRGAVADREDAGVSHPGR